jgi:hypothetical protein
MGFDAPETFQAKCEHEYRIGTVARHLLQQLIDNAKNVQLKDKIDKYKAPPGHARGRRQGRGRDLDHRRYRPPLMPEVTETFFRQRVWASPSTFAFPSNPGLFAYQGPQTAWSAHLGHNLAILKFGLRMPPVHSTLGTEIHTEVPFVAILASKKSSPLLWCRVQTHELGACGYHHGIYVFNTAALIPSIQLLNHRPFVLLVRVFISQHELDESLSALCASNSCVVFFGTLLAARYRGKAIRATRNFVQILRAKLWLIACAHRRSQNDYRGPLPPR